MKDYNEDIRWWVDVIFYNLYLIISDHCEGCGRRIKNLACICGCLVRSRRQVCKEMKNFCYDIYLDYVATS